MYGPLTMTITYYIYGTHSTSHHRASHRQSVSYLHSSVRGGKVSQSGQSSGYEKNNCENPKLLETFLVTQKTHVPYPITVLPHIATGEAESGGFPKLSI